MDFAWLIPLISAALSFIGGLAGAYFGGYLKTKGENLATHEDIDWLKEKVETVTTTTKNIETEIADAAWNRQKRWELKREVVAEAVKRLSEIQAALAGLHAIANIERKPGNEEWIEVVTEKYSAWLQTAEAFDKATEMLAVVCGKETHAAFEEFQLLAFRIATGIIEKKDAGIFMRSKEELAQRLFAARAAVRKELGIS